MLFKPKSYRYARTLFTLATLSAVLLIQGCFWESDDPAPPTYSIGGTVAGLTGTVVLQNNAGSDLTITINDSFSFGNNFSNGTSYDVTVLTNPAGQGCTVNYGNGSVNGATVSNIAVTCVDDADATGYYDTGFITEAGVNDLQALVKGNHIMLMSTSAGLVYDGTMIVTGTHYTATAKVYTNGANPQTVNFSGTITEDSNITGSITEGDVTVNGTFGLTYAISNNINSSNTALIHTWYGDISGTNYTLSIDSDGVPSFITRGAGGVAGLTCESFMGSVLPISSISLYALDLTLDSCDETSMQTSYSGLGTINASNELIIIFTTKISPTHGFLGTMIIP